MVTVQRIRKTCVAPIETAIRYYSIISVLNDLSLTEKETQLLAYTATSGTISGREKKKEFVHLFGGKSTYVNMMISRLSNRGLLVKDKGKYIVNPAILLDFNNTFLLQIKLDREDGSNNKEAT